MIKSENKVVSVLCHYWKPFYPMSSKLYVMQYVIHLVVDYLF